MVHQIQDKGDLQRQLSAAGDKLVVIDFFATWCGACKTIAPCFEAMAEEMSNVVFLKVDIDEVDDIDEEYDITGFPTFVFMKNGPNGMEKVANLVGNNAEKLRELVRKHA